MTKGMRHNQPKTLLQSTLVHLGVDFLVCASNSVSHIEKSEITVCQSFHTRRRKALQKQRLLFDTFLLLCPLATPGYPWPPLGLLPIMVRLFFLFFWIRQKESAREAASFLWRFPALTRDCCPWPPLANHLTLLRLLPLPDNPFSTEDGKSQRKGALSPTLSCFYVPQDLT